MGYTTEFTGVLKFRDAVTLAEIREVKKWMGAESPSREKDGWSYMQFELTPELDGIQWDGSEKFYGAEIAVQWLINRMRIVCPGFTLTGELQARGEETRDRWILRVQDNIAKKIPIKINGTVIECPHCKEQFLIDANSQIIK